eukprot:TRINITY_DN28825_c0_g1_i1.p1 TRINITY_DN28825_c0_g1~~TRINITY_DN28825_c0_g1_i1.p1  ORF type:complete len:550 (+),score=148.11 TRINITY_DN28825_c0_g1_i1:23-1672(+)
MPPWQRRRTLCHGGAVCLAAGTFWLLAPEMSSFVPSHGTAGSRFPTCNPDSVPLALGRLLPSTLLTAATAEHLTATTLATVAAGLALRWRQRRRRGASACRAASAEELLAAAKNDLEAAKLELEAAKLRAGAEDLETKQGTNPSANSVEKRNARAGSLLTGCRNEDGAYRVTVQELPGRLKDVEGLEVSSAEAEALVSAASAAVGAQALSYEELASEAFDVELRKLQGSRGAAAAAPTPSGGGKTWKMAHDTAKGLSEQLRSAIVEANRGIRELDALCEKLPTGKVTLDSLYPRPEGASRAGRDFSLYSSEKYFPDVEKTPPLLAGLDMSPIIGRYSDACKLPPYVSPEQIASAAADDPAASADENKLWKEALEAVLETQVPLWPQAKQATTALLAAEARADERQREVVENFKVRIKQQVNYAFETTLDWEEMDRYIGVLQQNERLKPWLALLERTALEAELAQEDLVRKQQVKDSDNARRKLTDVYDKTRSLDIRLRSCMEAARDMPGEMKAQEDPIYWLSRGLGAAAVFAVIYLILDQTVIDNRPMP